MRDEIQKRADQHQLLIRTALEVKGHTFTSSFNDEVHKDLSYVDGVNLSLEITEQGTYGGQLRYGNGKLQVSFGERWLSQHFPKRKTVRERTNQTFNVVLIVEKIEAYLRMRAKLDKRRQEANDAWERWREANERVDEAVGDHPGVLSTTSRGLELKFHNLTEKQAKALLTAAKTLIVKDGGVEEKGQTCLQRVAAS